MEDNNLSAFININGKPLKVFYDVQAMMDVEQTLELMKGGLVHREFMSLISPPYDTRDIVVMLMHGVNGANRSEGIQVRLGYPEAQKLYTDHLKYIGTVANTIENVKIMNEVLKNEISQAAQKGMGIFLQNSIT
jgi:hypothetical protein